MLCPITGEPMEQAFRATVLHRYQVQYYTCPASGLLRTEAPYWLAEAYSSAIAGTDTGLVQRNVANARSLAPLIQRLGRADGKLLDIAGGYGLLTRLLRDQGFDCYSVDEYCENLFAAAFEPGAAFAADLLFAFEVLEHLEDPVKFLEQVFARYRCRTLIFSTTTFEGPPPAADWWYYSFETGQHISFFQPRTLSLLAERLGCRYMRLRQGFHMFTDQPLSPRFLMVERSGLLSRLTAAVIRRQRRALSLTRQDHQVMKQRAADNVQRPAGVTPGVRAAMDAPEGAVPP